MHSNQTEPHPANSYIINDLYSNVKRTLSHISFKIPYNWKIVSALLNSRANPESANKIITLWNNLKEEESEKQNKKYPIEVLENINPEIDKLYSQLFNQFETLFEIKSISNDFY